MDATLGFIIGVPVGAVLAIWTTLWIFREEVKKWLEADSFRTVCGVCGCSGYYRGRRICAECVAWCCARKQRLGEMMREENADDV